MTRFYGESTNLGGEVTSQMLVETDNTT